MQVINGYLLTEPEWLATKTIADALVAMTAERDALKAKLDVLVLPPVPFTLPPLTLNGPSVGSTVATAAGFSIKVGQPAQSSPRVVRRDYGLLAPNSPAGSFLREPAETNLQYSVKVTIPADYKPVDMCNLFQLHTHTGQRPPYLSFMLWTTTSRWRHILPDGTYTDYNKQPIKLGHTYYLEVDAKWSKTKGYIRVREDGRPVMSYTGPTYRTDEVSPPYLLFGAYYPNVAEAFSNTLEFTELRRGGA